jgi:hypothetical protein
MNHTSIEPPLQIFQRDRFYQLCEQGYQRAPKPCDRPEFFVTASNAIAQTFERPPTNSG